MIQLPMPYIEGWPMLEKLDASGKVVQTVGPWRNTITNAGLNNIMSGSGASDIREIAAHGKVGTGTAPIAESTGTLPGYTTSVSRTGAVQLTLQDSALPYYAEMVAQFNFAVGAVVGTFGCVGISSSAGGSIHAASQIKDTEGNPTTITLLAEEQLRLTYRIRLYAPLDVSVPVSVMINGNPVDATLYTRNFTANTAFRLGKVNSMTLADAPNYPVPSSVLDTNQSYGSGANLVSGTTTMAAYVSGSFTRRTTTLLTSTQGNYARGINVIRFGDAFVRDIVLDTPVMKTNLHSFEFGADCGIARYTP